MKESLFIKQNKKKWKELEKHLASGNSDPDKLSDLYIQVSDDLSYARTFYQNRSVRLYLNNLAQKVYSNIYKSRRSRWSDIIFFWKEELPKIVWDSRKELTLSFCVFVLAVSIGVFSAIKDPEFVRVVLGDQYVNMTEANIEKGDPMAVYKTSKETDMFLGITLNNVKVDFLTFASGLVLGIGSILIMFYNGIMVGVFQYYFVQKGLFVDSALTIWLHGTLEMSGMVLAGAAGIRLGSGLVFPGTYSRLQAFQVSAMNGFKLLMGTIPITIFAAIIESFLTRYTETPDVIRLILILLSLFFIIGYFIVYPVLKSRRGFSSQIRQVKVHADNFTAPSTEAILELTELIRHSFSLFHHFFFSNAKVKSLALLLSFGLLIYALNDHLLENTDPTEWSFFTYFFEPDLPIYVHIMHIFNLSLLLFFAAFNIYGITTKEPISAIKFTLKHYYKALITAALIYPIALIEQPFLLLLALLAATPALILIFAVSVTEDIMYPSAIGRAFSYMKKEYMSLVGLFTLLSLCMILYYAVIESPITYFFIEFVVFNVDIAPESMRWIYIGFYTIFHYSGFFYIIPLCLYGIMWKLYSLKEIKNAEALTNKVHFLWK